MDFFSLSFFFFRSTKNENTATDERFACLVIDFAAIDLLLSLVSLFMMDL